MDEHSTVVLGDFLKLLTPEEKLDICIEHNELYCEWDNKSDQIMAGSPLLKPFYNCILSCIDTPDHEGSTVKIGLFVEEKAKED